MDRYSPTSPRGKLRLPTAFARILNHVHQLCLALRPRPGAIARAGAIAALALAAVLLTPATAQADVHAGTWSAKATLGGASYTQIYAVANVAANTTYTASLWIKGSGSLTFVVNNPAWTYFPATMTVTATNTWTQVTLPSFSSSTNTQMVIRLYDQVGSAGGSVTYIDDAFLGVSGGTNLLGNPGFESGNTGWNVGTAFTIGQFGSGPPLANGTYTLAPANATGLRLDVQGAGTTDGTNVQGATANSGTNQQWILTNVSGNTYRLSPANASGECLDVSGQATASGTNVQIWQYLSQANQQWTLTAVSGGYTLTPTHATALRLNITGTATGSNVNVTTANSSTAQTWNIVAVTGSAPAAPSGLTATSGQNGQVPLSWTASGGATSYSVYRGTTSNGQSGTAIASGITGTSMTDSTVTNGTAYYYKVKAVNASGASGYSNEASATPAAGGGAETIGGGTIASPASGPAASYSLGTGFTLVKNWNFGTNGTVKNMTDMSANFFYHDQFGTIANGTNYGAITIAADQATSINTSGFGQQPWVGQSGVPQVRSFTTDTLQTFLVPLNGATTVDVSTHNVGNGSFMAKFSLPNGGSLLNQDMIWETRVRMVTPPYFWFAIWSAGVQWNGGAEEDVVESFGYDNGGGNTNYDGRYWHSNSVGGTDTLVPNFINNWGAGMSSVGINSFDATQWHVWTWVYHKNNTYDVYMDGIKCQSGTINWTLAGTAGATPIDLWFLFDAGWGHTQIGSVNHSMPASNLTGKYYEWDYSRVYLKN